MVSDNETWLLDIGDEVIRKKAAVGYDTLSSMEKAIYCLWVIDYAVRNAGDLSALADLHPSAIDELMSFALSTHNDTLRQLLQGGKDDAEFCERYYAHFESVCNEIRTLYGRT